MKPSHSTSDFPFDHHIPDTKAEFMLWTIHHPDELEKRSIEEVLDMLNREGYKPVRPGCVTRNWAAIVDGKRPETAAVFITSDGTIAMLAIDHNKKYELECLAVDVECVSDDQMEKIIRRISTVDGFFGIVQGENFRSFLERRKATDRLNKEIQKIRDRLTRKPNK